MVDVVVRSALHPVYQFPPLGVLSVPYRNPRSAARSGTLLGVSPVWSRRWSSAPSPRRRPSGRVGDQAYPVAVARYEIRHRNDAGTQDGAWWTWFNVSQAGEHLRSVRVLVDRTMRFFAGKHLKLEDPWTSHEADDFQRGVFRLVTRRIEDALKAGAFEPAESQDFYAIDLNGDDQDTVSLLRELMLGDKKCSYQEHDSGNLFCTAASPGDETALPIIMGNGRRVAPTSRPLCAACSLPDTDYICSHFLHPQVIGVRATGGPTGFIRRDVTDGLCDLNQPEFANKRDCHAGGNPCWERIVDVDTTAAVAAVSPQAIEQALDDLEVRWRLAFGQSVVRLPRAEEVSSLAQPCSTRDEFERRLSSLADIIKLLDIPDELLPTADKLPEKSLTLARLELLFNERLAAEDRAEVAQAIGTLRNINRLRVGGQHSGAQSERAQAADRLGVALDGRWGDAWDRVRAVTSQALRDIGNAARRIADDAGR